MITIFEFNETMAIFSTPDGLTLIKSSIRSDYFTWRYITSKFQEKNETPQEPRKLRGRGVTESDNTY